MTRTPSLVPTLGTPRDPPGNDVTSSSSPAPSVTAEACTLWLFEDGTSAAPAPPTAIACSRAQVSHWLAGQIPAWLWARRTDGIAVLRDPSCGRELRRMARELRDLLAPRTAAGLLERVADSDGPLREALAALPGSSAPTFADLARSLATNPHPEAARLARLAWALEHL